LPESAEVAIYYVAAEALTNVAKHATGVAGDSLCPTPGMPNFTSRYETTALAEPSRRRGSGLAGLRDRIEAFGRHDGHL